MEKNNVNFLFYSKPVWFSGISGLEIQKLRGANETLREKARLTMRKALLGSFIKQRGKLKRWQFSDAVREKLYTHWVNDKAEVKPDDPKYLAMLELKDPYHKKAYYVLLAVLEKLHGRKKALKIFVDSYDPKSRTFNLYQIRKYFSKEKVGNEFGFYYGTRKVNWKVYLNYREALKLYYNVNAKMELKNNGWTLSSGSFTENYYIEKVHRVTGWWKVNSYRGNVNEIVGNTKSWRWGSSSGTSLLNELRKTENGDMYVSPKGKFTLLDAISNIKKQKYREWSLEKDREEEIFKMLDKFSRESVNYGLRYAKGQIYKYLTREAPKNTWFVFPKEKIGLMNRVFGRGVGNYKYRVTANKLYFIAITGTKFDPQYGIGGYIELKNKKVGKWTGCNPLHTENFARTLRKDVLKPMTLAQVKSELKRAEAREFAKSLPVGKLDKDRALAITKGMCSQLLDKLHVKRVFSYKLRDKKLYAPMGKELKAHIKKVFPSFSEARVSELVKFRITRLKSDFDHAVNDNKPLQLTVSSKPKTRIKIEINEEDVMKVDFLSETAKKYAERKYERKLKADEKAKKTEKTQGLLGKIKNKIQGFVEKFLEKTKLGKYAKVVAGFITNAISSFLNLGSLVKDWVGGKYKWIAGALGGGGVMAGLKLKGKRLTKAKLEKLTKNKSKYIFAKNYKVSSRIDLGRGSIVIKDGKDFIPVEGMQIRVNGGAVEKAKKPKTHGFLGISLGGGGNDYKGKKIEIVKFLPKGFKIKKGSIWSK
ncbi:hypothetical protein ACFL3C_01180 [Patescibacteria group bacterium]